jgi:hypothetical protein
MALKITLVLEFGRRRIHAKHRDSVKVTVKFIRRGIHFQHSESRLCPE